LIEYIRNKKLKKKIFKKNWKNKKQKTKIPKNFEIKNNVRLIEITSEENEKSIKSNKNIELEIIDSNNLEIKDNHFQIYIENTNNYNRSKKIENYGNNKNFYKNSID
jgi:hypothetical protein